MRLSPHDPEVGWWLWNLGHERNLAWQHYDDAIDEEQALSSRGRHYYLYYAILAAAYALQGKMDEAKAALAEARRVNPELTVKWLQTHCGEYTGRVEGLRKAGLPKGEEKTN